MSDIVVPGDRLGSVHDVLSGKGTYIRGNHVYASVLGVKCISTPSEPASAGQALPSVSVVRTGVTASEPIVPEVGVGVTGRVTAINPRAATVQILCVNGVAVAAPFAGVIRKENAVASDIDRIGMEQIVRPGDIVLAEVMHGCIARVVLALKLMPPVLAVIMCWCVWYSQVISLGDSKSYFLTTAKEELGVVYAKNEVGSVLAPISLTQMECPVTRVKYDRKVAKLDA
jgi:exosome complex component CSL4